MINSPESGRTGGEELAPLFPTDFDSQSCASKRSFIQQLYAILAASRLNILLLFIPIGYVSHYLGWSNAAVFSFNFVAIIPLAKLLGYSTEQVALHTSQTIGGLLNASFGNAVELIIAIAALRENLITVVQTSLLGSILSNCLLVLGFCFALGGWNRSVQSFNTTAAQTSAGLLFLAVTSLIVPGAFALIERTVDYSDPRILNLSRGTAIILLVVYFLYLVFQLKTHSNLFLDSNGEEEEECKELTLGMGIGILILITVLVAISAEFLVGSIEGLSKDWDIPEAFVGMILLPIVGNAAEHATAVTSAMKDKMDLAIGVAVGSSTQIALLITPLMVILGWIIRSDFSLLFNVFDIAVLFVSVLSVNYIIMDGKSNWLEGVMLLGTYLILGIAFFNYPSF